MRTTVRLDDDLLREAKRAAVERGTTLTAVIEDALREALARRADVAVPAALPTYSGSGVGPGVDLDDSAALLELLEADDPPL